jgi:hypothetical protein
MSAITSATRVYHDNFLQYRITGEPRYKKVADDAMTTIQKVIDGLKQQVSSVPVHDLRDLRLKRKTLEENLFKEKDRLKEAEMRGIPSGQPVESSTWKYVTIGGLLAITILLQNMQS